MANIFHILSKKEWEKVKNQDSYAPPSLESDGFIHCAHTDQILSVANNFYRGHDHLIILRIDETLLSQELKNEPPLEAPMSGILYPHLYGPLNLNAVTGEIPFSAEENGTFKLPKNLLK